jgi:hypothetical protein
MHPSIARILRGGAAFALSSTVLFAALTSAPAVGKPDEVWGDFNGDGLLDLFIPARLPHQPAAVLPGAAEGEDAIVGWEVPLGSLGLEWNDQSHTLLTADLDGDGRDELIFQPRTLDDALVVARTDAQGQFTSILQTASADLLGFDWTTSATRIVAGDFDADGRDELLLQANDSFGLFYVIEADAKGRLDRHGQG